MSEKRPEGHAAVQRALFQSQLVECDSNIVADNARNQCACLCRERKGRSTAAESGKRRHGQRKRKKDDVQAVLNNCFHSWACEPLGWSNPPTVTLPEKLFDTNED